MIILSGMISLLAAIAAYATPSSLTQSAPSQSDQPLQINAIQRQADRAGKDRWARSEADTDQSDSSEEPDEDSTPASQKLPLRSAHELNGKLHLGDW